MTNSAISDTDEPCCKPVLPGIHLEPNHAHASGVSWSAIIAGAFAAAALSLILLMLGTGLELSSVSPWAYNGVSAKTFGASTILWLTFTQLIASGMGGYLAGRLRHKWIGVHTDEIYFRDTAHGFLAWTVATILTAALLTSVIGSIVNSGIQAGASVVGGVATAATGSGLAKSDNNNEPMGYFVDTLFRKDINATGDTLPEATTESATNRLASEVTRIFMNTIRTGNLPEEDIRYVGQVVAQRTGLTQQDAEKRVTAAYTRLQIRLHDSETAAKEAADSARKASAYTALWLFISLLIGAFVASFAAIYGGRQRDL